MGVRFRRLKNLMASIGVSGVGLLIPELGSYPALNLTQNVEKRLETPIKYIKFYSLQMRSKISSKILI